MMTVSHAEISRIIWERRNTTTKMNPEVILNMEMKIVC